MDRAGLSFHSCLRMQNCRQSNNGLIYIYLCAIRRAIVSLLRKKAACFKIPRNRAHPGGKYLPFQYVDFALIKTLSFAKELRFVAGV